MSAMAPDGPGEAIPAQMLLGAIGPEIDMGQLGLLQPLVEVPDLLLITEVQDGWMAGHAGGGHLHLQHPVSPSR